MKGKILSITFIPAAAFAVSLVRVQATARQIGEAANATEFARDRDMASSSNAPLMLAKSLRMPASRPAKTERLEFQPQ